MVSPSSLSTVLAQDHFYSDFLSLLLTKQIHFESVMMIAFCTALIECFGFCQVDDWVCCAFAEQIIGKLFSSSLSLFAEAKQKPLSYHILIGGFGNELLLKNLSCLAARHWLARLLCPSHNPPFIVQRTSTAPCDIGLSLRRQKGRQCFASSSLPVDGARWSIPSRPFGYDQM